MNEGIINTDSFESYFQKGFYNDHPVGRGIAMDICGPTTHVRGV
jgi:hypothetical protein